jgi:molybdopterin-guanine dinucleotide biosynthesis protein A
MVGAAILAGGLTDDALFEKTQTREKALVAIHGQPMLQYVIEAVTSCSAIDEAVIACPAESAVAQRDWGGIPHTVAKGHDPIDSIVAGAEALTAADRVLICACDLPLLTPEAIGEFVAEGLEAGADCCYPILSEQVIEAEFPGCPRTYVRFRDGRFTSGNIALVARGFVVDRREKIHQAFSVRKSPLKMAALLGPMAALGLALGTASIEGLANRAAKVLHCTVCVVQSRHPEIAFDVDKPSDLELAQEALVRRAAGRPG